MSLALAETGYSSDGQHRLLPEFQCVPHRNPPKPILPNQPWGVFFGGKINLAVSLCEANDTGACSRITMAPLNRLRASRDEVIRRSPLSQECLDPFYRAWPGHDGDERK